MDTDPEILLSRIRAILLAVGCELPCRKCGTMTYLVLEQDRRFSRTYTLDGENHVSACKGKGSE